MSAARWLLAGVLAGATALASAQQALDPNSVVNAGVAATKLLDEGRYAEIWDGASAAMKKVAAKAQFVDAVGKARQAAGATAPTERVWIDVWRRDEAGSAQLPAGVYMNVTYRTVFAKGLVARELVSFRLDEDKTWRFTGYVLN
ncbi:MAG TPA: DUF4019 domain-containing protein [Burkholderiaceae bacterium]